MFRLLELIVASSWLAGAMKNGPPSGGVNSTLSDSELPGLAFTVIPTVAPTPIPSSLPTVPFRMPVSGVYKIKGVGDVITGRIEQGFGLLATYVHDLKDAVAELLTPPRILPTNTTPDDELNCDVLSATEVTDGPLATQGCAAEVSSCCLADGCDGPEARIGLRHFFVEARRSLVLVLLGPTYTMYCLHRWCFTIACIAFSIWMLGKPFGHGLPQVVAIGREQPNALLTQATFRNRVERFNMKLLVVALHVLHLRATGGQEARAHETRLSGMGRDSYVNITSVTYTGAGWPRRLTRSSGLDERCY